MPFRCSYLRKKDMVSVFLFGAFEAFPFERVSSYHQIWETSPWVPPTHLRFFPIGGHCSICMPSLRSFCTFRCQKANSVIVLIGTFCMDLLFLLVRICPKYLGILKKLSWLMPYSSFEACTKCCHHGEEKASWIHIRLLPFHWSRVAVWLAAICNTSSSSSPSARVHNLTLTRYDSDCLQNPFELEGCWKCFTLVSRLKDRQFFHDMADVEQFLHRCHVWMWTHVPRMALPMESSLEDDVTCAGYGCRMVTQHNMIQARI